MFRERLFESPPRQSTPGSATLTDAEYRAAVLVCWCQETTAITGPIAWCAVESTRSAKLGLTDRFYAAVMTVRGRLRASQSTTAVRPRAAARGRVRFSGERSLAVKRSVSGRRRTSLCAFGRDATACRTLASRRPWHRSALRPCCAPSAFCRRLRPRDERGRRPCHPS